MKIAPLSESLLTTATSQGSLKIQKSFERVRSELTPALSNLQILGPDLSRELAHITKAALSGKQLTAQELVAFQVKAGQFGLRVELISKMAEAGISTLKKLQNPQ